MSDYLQTVLNGMIIGVNMDYERKEPLFYLVNRVKTPSIFIQEVNKMFWYEEDKEDIKKLIKTIKTQFNHKD